MDFSGHKYLPSEFDNKEDTLSLEKFVQNKIKNFFKGYNKNTVQNILYFKKDFNIGYIDALTMKEIVPLSDTRIFIDEELFSPNIKGSIHTNKASFHFEYQPEGNLEIKPYNKNWYFMPIKDNSERTVYTNTKTKIVTPYNKPFKIEDIFHYKKNSYIIAKKITDENQLIGILDEKEIPLPEFDFQYELIEKNKYSEDNIWFLTRKKGDKFSYFISISGEKKNFLIKNMVEKQLGYAIIELKNKEMGVIDLKTMEWIIKPQKKWILEKFRHTSKEKIDTENIENRNKAKLYIYVWENGYNYFIDLSEKKYIPSKYINTNND